MSNRISDTEEMFEKQYNTGYKYYFGIEVEQNYDIAVELFEKTCEFVSRE